MDCRPTAKAVTEPEAWRADGRLGTFAGRRRPRALPSDLPAPVRSTEGPAGWAIPAT